MKYKEQFFSTYEEAVRRMDAGIEISEKVCDPEYVEGCIDGSGYYYDRTLTLSATRLTMSDNHYYDYDDETGGTPIQAAFLEMNSGRDGIAKLMFRYDIPLTRNDKGEIDGEAMLESLFETLSHVGITKLLNIFLNLNISFTYTA